MLNTKCLSGENKGDHVDLHLEKDGERSLLKTEYVLVAIGRSANTSSLNLDTVGIATDDKGRVIIDEELRTPSHSHIYAIGDCVEGQMLAHKAEEEGIFVAETIAGQHTHLNHETIPGVVYTYPEMAQVGKTEEQLKTDNVPYKKGVFPFLANSRARAYHDSDGMVKVLAHAESDRILGVHIIGPNAGELIMEAVLALEYHASSEDIARIIHAHPSYAEAFKEACMAAYDKPIHY